MHPAILRTLENWTTHQDYFWFLAVLAWGAFIGAEVRRKDASGRSGRGWLVALAVFQITGALLELVLIAQDMLVPYTRLDAAMGLAQAGGTGALAWGARGRGRRAWAGVSAVWALLLGLAALRTVRPVEAGVLLAMTQAALAFVLCRRERGTFPSFVALVLAVQPIVATHGPWAYGIEHGRRYTDWSHFALPAAALTIAAGAAVATAAWRRRLRDVMPDGVAGGVLRRDLRRAVMLLIAWLAGGALLASWYGRQAREAFETNLLRRTELAALGLDLDKVTEAFAADLPITSIRTQRFPHGATVEVATIPQTAGPVYAGLRNRLMAFKERNPDFRWLDLQFHREGRLIVFSSDRRRPDNPYITHIIYGPVTREEEMRRTTRVSYINGPVVSYRFGAVFEARVPLLDPRNGDFLAWVSAAVDATRWATTFVQARLQTMALVAAGVSLWIVAVAYRLRREARDAAEQKAVAAAAADRMKSVFLAKVSHELRTPIQSVLGYSELLASAPLGEPHRAWLSALRTHGDVMLRLVNDLIDLGALQSGAFQLEKNPVRLRRVIDDCLAALRPMATAKGLAFEVHVASDLPIWVQADAVRLRQVLLNLLTNAVKFTPQGEVSLAVRKTRENELEFVVSDTGPGIPSAQRARLFQPFTRLDPTAVGGSGLGLALVQGICAAMGGTVQLDEASGGGATFVVRVRCDECPPPAQEPAPMQAATPSLAGFHILIAEDNSLVRELLVAFLSGEGAQVSIARDGPAALALAREFPPDILLLDIGLPEMDGIAVAETLRRDGATMRIVGLSAQASAADEARAREAGMDDFLTKPVRLDRLARAIAPHHRQDKESPSSVGMDRTLRTRLATQFARETPLVLADLRAALAAGDYARLRRAAHYLKNSADVLGLERLQAACQKLCLLADHDAPDAARPLLEALEEAIPPQLLVLEGPD